MPILPNNPDGNPHPPADTPTEDRADGRPGTATRLIASLFNPETRTRRPPATRRPQRREARP